MACQIFVKLTRRVTSLINTGARRLDRSFLWTHRKLISAAGNVLMGDEWSGQHRGHLDCYEIGCNVSRARQDGEKKIKEMWLTWHERECQS